MIRFNHPRNTLTSTGNTQVIVNGGTPSNPFNFEIFASSVVLPNTSVLPLGKKGAIVYDAVDTKMKYFNGFEWVSWANQSEIEAGVEVNLDKIYAELAKKVDTVKYSSGKIPSASIDKNVLSIIFPLVTEPHDPDKEIPGLFTSSPSGSIMHYAVASGQTIDSIREQMSGVVNGQEGRDGTQTKPYVTKTGWVFADGKYWEWNGQAGKIIKQVPNLNQSAYLKGLSPSGITNIEKPNIPTPLTSEVTITLDNLPRVTIPFSGKTKLGSLPKDSVKSFQRWSLGSTIPNVGKPTTPPLDIQSSGDNTQTANYLIPSDVSATLHSHDFNGEVVLEGRSIPHKHDITGVDVHHFSTAILYNIAEPSVALNENAGDKRYVLKKGDIMTGSLEVANELKLKTGNQYGMISIVDNNNAERCSMFHNTNDNTLNLRTRGGTPIKIYQNGKVDMTSLNVTSNDAKVAGKNIVRSVGGITADNNGNVEFSGLPAGSIIAFPSINIPTGFLRCNGQSFDKAKYPKLALLFPNGKLPDMRGVFLRGLDEGRGLDPNRTILSLQNDAIQKSAMEGSFDALCGYDNGNAASGVFKINRSFSSGIKGGGGKGWGRNFGFNFNLPQFASETRPVNVTVVYIVRGE